MLISGNVIGKTTKPPNPPSALDVLGGLCRARVPAGIGGGEFAQSAQPVLFLRARSWYS